MRYQHWVIVCIGLAAYGCSGDGEKPQGDPPPKEQPAEEGPAEASPFATVAQVLRHPRCLNCHPSGDRPRVGDEAKLHPQNVQRGPKNHGMPGMHCATCHQPENQELAQVPGAPHWSLAPRSMGWEGLSDRELAQTLTDESKNGGRSLEALLEHVSHDPLVRWGWDPGPGREAIPVAHEEFVAAFRAWIEDGAPAPEEK